MPAGANVNRSPTSYLLNPRAERARYAGQGDTDRNMTLVRFVDAADGSDIGVLNWFAVHGTSMNNTNRLISGDNKGYAGYAWERAVNGATRDSTAPGMGPFVAAFAATFSTFSIETVEVPALVPVLTPP